MTDKSVRINRLQLELQSLERVKKKLEDEIEMSYSAATKTNNLDVTQEDYENERETHLKMQHVLQKMTVFRLCGLTVLNHNNVGVTFRLEATYSGRYYDHYVVQFKLYRSKWTIEAHTLPWFIPLNEILENCGGNNLKQIVTEIQTYVDAYSCRMAQVKKVQEKYGSSVSITNNSSYEFISFYLTEGPQHLIDATFLLSYSLREEVPTKVQVLAESSKPRHDRTFDEVTNRLKEFEISECIKYIIDQ